MKPSALPRWAAGAVFALSLLSFRAEAALEINQAPAHDLVAIKGIGPSTSEKILVARRAGPFKDWADLAARVKGVGPATARKWSGQGLRVNGQPYTDEATGPAPKNSNEVTEWRPMVPRPLLPIR